MRIVELRERTAPIGSAIRNAFIDFSSMTVSVVAVITDAAAGDGGGRPVIGYGFCSNGRYAQGGILRERLFPRVLAAEPGALLDAAAGRNLDPLRVWDAAMRNEKPGGHGDRAVAMAALDMAVWDAAAKIEGVPLWRLLADRFNGGRHDRAVMVYPGGGYYYPGKELEQLQAEMRGYRDQGYRVCKMKIGGAPLEQDLRRIEAALEVVGSGANLAVDANGRFDLETAVAYACAMEPYGLAWFEEPGDPLDYALNAEVCRAYRGGVATGENLFSRQDVRNLVRYGGMRPEVDWIQPDPALAYGLTEFLRIVEVIERAEGWSRRRVVPHGGHQLGLHAAAGLQLGGTETYPLVFQPYGGFADDTAIEGGRVVRLPDAPGLGVERKAAMHAELRRLLET